MDDGDPAAPTRTPDRVARSRGLARFATFRAIHADHDGRSGQRIDSAELEQHAANDDAVADVAGGALVLRGREKAVQDTVEELYGDKLVTSSVRGSHDYAGHEAGRRAADAAKLGAGEVGGGGGRG